jgi:hypothetical protein
MVKIEPPKIILDINQQATIKAIVNETDLSNLKFEWFKFNRITQQDELIRSNFFFRFLFLSLNALKKEIRLCLKNLCINIKLFKLKTIQLRILQI